MRVRCESLGAKTVASRERKFASNPGVLWNCGLLLSACGDCGCGGPLANRGLSCMGALCELWTVSFSGKKRAGKAVLRLPYRSMIQPGKAGCMLHSDRCCCGMSKPD